MNEIPCALSWDSAQLLLLECREFTVHSMAVWLGSSLIHSFGWSVTARGSLGQAGVSAWLLGSPWELLERGKVFPSDHSGQRDTRRICASKPKVWQGCVV